MQHLSDEVIDIVIKDVGVVGQVIEQAAEATGVATALKEVKQIIASPAGSMTTKVLSTVGVTVGTIATVSVVATSANTAASSSNMLLNIVRMLDALLVAFGIRKKAQPWGVAYDAVTKQPLDPAYITLQNAWGKEVAHAITDIDGRYGFFIEPGSYRILAKKTNYAFPSQKLMGRGRDEVYGSLYFGDLIDVKRTGEVIVKNIPLDPIKFDWNEFAKKNKTFMKFYSRWDALFRKVSDLFFVVGFFVAAIAFLFAPYPYNTIILLLYMLLLILRILGLKAKPLGYVIDTSTGAPLSFAILRVMMPSTNIELSHKITDAYGRYYCLVPKGRYYVKIEKKHPDGSYSLVHTSSIIDAKKHGIIKERFEVGEFKIYD